MDNQLNESLQNFIKATDAYLSILEQRHVNPVKVISPLFGFAKLNHLKIRSILGWFPYLLNLLKIKKS